MAPDIEHRPIPGPTWDDIDHQIYEHRIRQHRSLRDVAAIVNLHHSTVRDRLDKMMRRVTFAEIDEMRTEEGHRLDELAAAHQNAITSLSDYAQTLIEAEVIIDPDTLINLSEHNLKLRREIHALARTRHQLFGLNASGNPEDADLDRINDLVAAYLAGVNDTEDTTA